MWRSRTKSTARIHNTSPLFQCSSFKDIQRLCSDDSDHHHHHQSTKKPSIFHRVRLANSVLRSWSTQSSSSSSSAAAAAAASPDNEVTPLISLLPGGSDKRIVVYFTSLRVVRSTFEDCRTVQSILRGFRVWIDERDVSMDSTFMEELKTILGQFHKSKLKLPRVFIGGRYIGGADEIRQLHEAGELKKVVEGFPAADPGVCEVCGGYRFILCDECSGSHKCYSEKGGFRSCTLCNENGLIRCPSCYYYSAPI